MHVITSLFCTPALSPERCRALITMTLDAAAGCGESVLGDLDNDCDELADLAFPVPVFFGRVYFVRSD